MVPEQSNLDNVKNIYIPHKHLATVGGKMGANAGVHISSSGKDEPIDTIGN